MHKLRTVFFSIIMIAVIFEIMTTYAEQKPPEKLENVAVSLVIDTSGSMQQTDPQNLRGTASNIFIDLLSPEDYLGIITFDTDIDIAVPLKQVGNTQNKLSLKKQLSPKLAASGDTNYTAAMNAAKKQLDGLKNSDLRKVIVFITDGTPDPDPSRKNDSIFMNSYMNSLWNNVTDISISQYPVYSVGFGKETDPKTLKRISSETGGAYIGIDDSAQLASSFF